MQEQVVEQQSVTSREPGSHDARRARLRSTTGSPTKLANTTPCVPVSTSWSNRRGTTSRAGTSESSPPQSLSATHTFTVRRSAPMKAAVLVPDVAGVDRHPPQGALLERCGRALAQVVGDGLVQTSLGERLDQLEEHPGRVGEPHPASVTHIRARQHLVGDVPVGLVLDEPRRGLRGRGAPGPTVVGLEGAVDPLHEPGHPVRREQLSHQQAPVVADPARQGVQVELSHADLGQPVVSVGEQVLASWRP